MKQLVKLEDFARYVGISLLQKGLSVSPLKLQKMLYYHQAWHMVIFGKENTLFQEAPEAWVNGPVYPSIYQIYKSKTKGMCDHLRMSDFINHDETPNYILTALATSMRLDEDELELADEINVLYGSKTQNQLILLTHSEKPWCKEREGLKPYEYSNNPISLEVMYNYYRARYERNHK